MVFVVLMCSQRAQELGSSLLEEDDENIELWYVLPFSSHMSTVVLSVFSHAHSYLFGCGCWRRYLMGVACMGGTEQNCGDGTSAAAGVSASAGAGKAGKKSGGKKKATSGGAG